MATIARETELSTALRRASPSGDFIEARMLPLSLRFVCLPRPLPCTAPEGSSPGESQGGKVPGTQHRHFAFM